MAYWATMHNDYREENIVFISAWRTYDPDEEGRTIAKVNIVTKEVEYLDERAKYDDRVFNLVNEAKMFDITNI